MDDPITRLQSRPGLRLALLAFAMLIVAIDFNIVYVALPEIGRVLGFSVQSLQWVVSAYAVGFGGFLLLGGRMVDRLGPRRMFMLAIMIYAGSSLIGGLAPISGLLVAARFVQGLGGALLFPATLALIHINFEEGPERNRAMAVWGTAAASGLIVGAGAGGLLTYALGWPWVFFVNVPLALGAALVTPSLLAADPSPKTGRGGFDLPGTLIASAGSALAVFGLVSGPEVGWFSVRGAGAVVLGVALLGIFLLVEKRSANPVMPLRLFKNRSLVMAMALVVVFATAINALHYVYFVHLQNVLGFNALQAGLSFLPISVGGMLGSGKALPWFLHKCGLRTSLFLGILGIGISMALFAAVMSVDGPYWAMLPATLLWGFAAGIAFSGIFLAAGARVAPSEQGVASAMASSSQQIGGAVGLAVLVAVANAGLDPRSAAALPILAVEDGLRRAMWVGAVITITGAFVAFALKKSEPEEQPELPPREPTAEVATTPDPGGPGSAPVTLRSEAGSG